jgi:hypothetical protein
VDDRHTALRGGCPSWKGGFFKVRSGKMTIQELAVVYENQLGVALDVTCGGSLDHLERELARLRKEKEERNI